MYSSKSGEKRTVNSAGKTHFGKWYLSQTSEKEDRWRKDVVDDDQGIIIFDSWIMIVRTNVNAREGVYNYSVRVAGEARWLREHFEAILGIEPQFDSIQHAKDQVDRVLAKIDKLIAFI